MIGLVNMRRLMVFGLWAAAFVATIWLGALFAALLLLWLV